jgi:hypothetical protein
MSRFAAIVLATAVAAGSSPAFAGNAGHVARAGHSHDPTVHLGPPAPMPAPENRIPAPLAAPAGPPVINGPISQPAFRGLTGIGQ